MSLELRYIPEESNTVIALPSVAPGLFHLLKRRSVDTPSPVLLEVIAAFCNAEDNGGRVYRLAMHEIETTRNSRLFTSPELFTPDRVTNIIAFGGELTLSHTAKTGQAGHFLMVHRRSIDDQPFNPPPVYQS